MSEEKPENKRRERDEEEGIGMRGRWHRGSNSGLFFGLILVLLGAVFFLPTQGYISWGDWWKYFIIGLGVIFLIAAFMRYARPAYRGPRFFLLITGLILICIGLAFILGLGNWWPLIPIVLGLAILLRALLRRKTG
jgi:hypothetical protein